MHINNQDTEVVFTFKPRNYFLIYANDDRFPNADMKVWTLNPRIDMSYKGKDDQVGMPVLYLSEQEAEACKKAGFSWIDETGE